ncbi:SRPBCC domain-containing protein [Euzebya sp.]|uniref:SRPBCC family protein n=1 Tax=Euzebya sp. TaxID=1971409 RepID=UPI003512AB43
MTARTRLDGDELIAIRDLQADVDLVWLAFTTPQHLAAFWGGHHATVRPGSVSVDLRVGGGFELETRGADGTSRRLRFRYDVVEPPTRLSMLEPLTGITTDIRFEPTSTGTRVVVNQRRLPPELQTEHAATGLAGILDRLDTALQTI